MFTSNEIFHANKEQLIKTAFKKRGFLCGYKPLLPARVSRRCFHFVQAIAFDSRQPSKGFIFLLILSPCFFLFIRLLLCFWEWICVLFYTHFIHCYIMHFLLSNIFCNCCIIQPYSTYIISFTPKMSVSKLIFQICYFRFACLSNIINADFPFRYPINADTDNDGGIITSMCTWSLIKCPSIISTCLYLHNSLNISPKSFRYWLYITFRLYFGVKMMWYLHIHFVCAKEFALLAIIITILSYFDSLNTFIIERMVIILYNFIWHHPHSRWFCCFVLRTQLAKAKSIIRKKPSLSK